LQRIDQGIAGLEVTRSRDAANRAKRGLMRCLPSLEFGSQLTGLSGSTR
jgi:hypothetical protein